MATPSEILTTSKRVSAERLKPRPAAIADLTHQTICHRNAKEQALLIVDMVIHARHAAMVVKQAVYVRIGAGSVANRIKFDQALQSLRRPLTEAGAGHQTIHTRDREPL